MTRNVAIFGTMPSGNPEFEMRRPQPGRNPKSRLITQATRWGLLIAVALVNPSVPASPLATESEALAALHSAVTPADKEAACRRLKEVGTAKCVPVLKALLADESLAQWVVDALQTLPAREAGEALLLALPGTSGKTKALVIFSLGVRRETAAVPALTAALASEPDAVVATAAAKALGRIGGDSALAGLRDVRPRAKDGLRLAVAHALLAVADDVLANGDPAKARSIYAELRNADEAPPVRAAAFRGWVLAGDGVAAILGALNGVDEPEQVMAVQLAREFPEAGATRALADVLPELPSRVQVAALEALRQRGDPGASVAVAMRVRENEPTVRIAALKAMGELGDASHVNLLAEFADRGPGRERSEAREALVTLHRGDVTQTILAEIQRAKPGAQVELVRALGRRMDRRAIPELLRLAGGDDAKLGVAAIQALEKLATHEQMHPLLGLVTTAADDARREAAVSAFATVGLRGRSAGRFSAAALAALADAAPQVRCGLIEAAGLIGGTGVIEVLRAALADADAEVRATALRTMAENAGDEARPDLLRLARELSTASDREQALRGYWRLVEAMTDRPQTDRLSVVREGFAVAKTAADRKLGLARLGELQGEAALALAQQYRSDEAVRAEAETAVFQIASRLHFAQRALVETTLRGLAAEAAHDRARANAETLLATLEAQAGCIAPWFVTGPFRKPGLDGQQLFDIEFAPEMPGETQSVWRPLPLAAALTNYGYADLGPVVRGNHCVVYLKARVFCPGAQRVALEIGSDDGLKLWINGKVVHANNVARGFTAGQDKVEAELNAGVNEFLVKVSQHTAGCAASVRVRTPEGRPVPGLRVEVEE